MDSPGYILLARLALQERSTQVLAHNIANADTPVSGPCGRFSAR